MEFQEVLTKRRSIRKFLPREVEEEKVREIISAGLLAPSAHFREPWKIYWLTKEEKQKVVTMMKEYVERTNTSDSSILKTASVLEQASTLLSVFNTSQEDLTMDLLSIGAMMENMCLKATDLQVASLWVGNPLFVKKEICSFFSVPATWQLVGGIVLGYSEHIPSSLTRKTLEEVLRREH